LCEIDGGRDKNSSIAVADRQWRGRIHSKDHAAKSAGTSVQTPDLIQREDEDVFEAVKTILEDEGINIRLSAECVALEKHGDKIAVKLDCSSGDKMVIGSHVLLAVGRVPNTDDLGVENAGIVVDQRGYIQVDDQLRTNVPGIYALGDCNG
jgi:pyruvate/2-oxoglutarate dehydrogenase complex dihydrolipoamide dehydrogenase (E3) component